MRGGGGGGGVAPSCRCRGGTGWDGTGWFFVGDGRGEPSTHPSELRGYPYPHPTLAWWREMEGRGWVAGAPKKKRRAGSYCRWESLGYSKGAGRTGDAQLSEGVGAGRDIFVCLGAEGGVEGVETP